MFQYTGEVIINSNEGNLVVWDATAGTPAEVSGLRFAAVKMDASHGLSKVASGATHLLVDGVNLLDGKYITAAYKNEYVAPVNESIALTLSSASTGDVLRLKVATVEEGLTSPIYLDAQLRHKKPFFYEVKVGSTTTATAIAAEFAKVINAEMQMTDFKFFKASDASGVLTLTAQNCYTRFEEIRIDKIHESDDNPSGMNITGWQDYDEVLAWKRGDTNGSVSLTAGTEGAGTVARLIKNLRVPTDANTDPFGPDNGGRPVPGGHYDQYTIEYCTDRRHIGGQVVGAIDKSLTTHVFFIESAISSAFSSDITNILTTAANGVVLTNAKGDLTTSPVQDAIAANNKKSPVTGSKQ